MAPEIADSDDEGDFPVQPSDTYHIPPGNHTNIVVAEDLEMAEIDPVLNLDFEVFCSPTQHLSDFDVDQYTTQHQDLGPDSSNLLDSSANRFLNEVAPITSSYEAEARKRANSSASGMGGKNSASKAGHKRTRSQVDESASVNQNGSANKKTKIYGSSNTSSNATQDLAMFNNGVGINSSDMISVEPRSQYTPDTISLLSPFDVGNNKGRSPHSQMYAGPPTFTRNGSFQNMQGGIASRSSMGNYQSYTLDRSALEGNFNEINPFGQPSQMEGGEDTEALATIFKAKTGSRQSTSQDAADGIMFEMQTSPTKSNPTIAPEQLTAQPEPPTGSPPFSPITNPDENSSLEAVIQEDILGEVIEMQQADRISVPPEVPVTTKKRGRKPKQKNADSTKVLGADTDAVNLDGLQFRRSDRAGTVDSVSNLSEISQATTTSKTSRKKGSKKNTEYVPEDLSKKLPSSDLGLDNKAVIGLSPERYVPRPSRRRGHAEPDLVPSVEADESANPNIEIAQEEQAPKGKKGRKGRGKQKPTTADEVAVVDTKSEVIVLDDDKKAVDENTSIKSSERLDNPNQVVDEDEAEDEVPKNASRRAKITVDVPPLPKPEEHEMLPVVVPEPKKRGRKKKKQVEIPGDEPATPVIERDDRPALAEKDTNVQTKKPETAKITPEAEVSASNVEEELVDSKPATPVTPSAALSTTTPNTKMHSDFKPLSATPFFNAKGRIGLSKRTPIPSLLRKVDRNKEAPKAIERKEKLNKRQLEEREAERIAKEEAEAEGRDYVPLDQLRGKDGRLIEWDF